MSGETLDWYIGPYLALAHCYVFICWSARKWTAESHTADSNGHCRRKL